MISDNKDFGLVYVATGKKYTDETIYSAKSYRQFNPDTPITVFTDTPEVFNGLGVIFTQVEKIDKPYYSLRDKLYIRHTPYRKTIFIDTDTVCFGPLTELFDLLERCDLIIHQNAEGFEYDYKKYGFNEAMAEFNTGVIGFIKEKLIEQDFFVNWEKIYHEYNHLKLTDQFSFRKLIYETQIRYCWIPSAYNFFIYFPAYTAIPVKIVHGRPFSKLEEIGRKINETDKLKASWHRCYFPDLDEVVYDKINLQDSFTLFKKHSTIFLKNIYRKLKS